MLGQAISRINLSINEKFRLIPHLMTCFDKVSKVWSTGTDSHSIELLNCLEEAGQQIFLLGLLNDTSKIQDFL